MDTDEELAEALEQSLFRPVEGQHYRKRGDPEVITYFGRRKNLRGDYIHDFRDERGWQVIILDSELDKLILLPPK